MPDFSFALPEMFLSIADKYKKLSLIIGHMGLERWRQVIEMVNGYKNIFFDITMSMPNPERLEFAVEKVRADRVLLGTDTHLLDPGVSLGLIYGSSLSMAEKEKIIGGNILSILEKARNLSF